MSTLKIRMHKVPRMFWCFGKWPVMLPGGLMSELPANDTGLTPQQLKHVAYWYRLVLIND